MKMTTIKNLMILLSEGKLISNDLECLKDVLEAAKIFGIEPRGWSIDIEEGENIGSEVEKSITEPLAKHGFSYLKWEDCEIVTHNGKSIENINVNPNHMEGHRKRGRPKKIVNGRM